MHRPQPAPGDQTPHAPGAGTENKPSLLSSPLPTPPPISYCPLHPHYAPAVCPPSFTPNATLSPTMESS